MAYSVREIADLAGLTTRTIRYYDEIGLLNPVSTGANGYRYYNQDSLLRLQQIRFYRELDLSLDDIHLIMNQPDFNLLDALGNHRQALQGRQKRIQRLINTIDQTILALKDNKTMKEEKYFNGFNESEYEEESRQRWGDTSMYKESKQKWSSYSAEQKEGIKAEGGRLAVRMVGSSSDVSPNNPDVQATVGEYLAYLNKYFYSCDPAFLRNLADMWVSDPRYAANYENVRAGGAEFVRQAVNIYCDNQ